MNVQVIQEHHHILARFGKPCRVLSSAVLNGGLTEACQLLNMKVSQNHHGRKENFETPELTLQHHADDLKLTGPTIGMMTSASMRSYRSAVLCWDDIFVQTIVTSGVANAKRVGEPAEWRRLDAPRPAVGTINLVCMTNLALTIPAMVEAVMMVTEAKAAVLQDLAVPSAATGAIATGTGTDAVAVVSDPDGRPACYCGKHVLLGEKLARTVSASLKASIKAWSPPRGNTVSGVASYESA